MSDRFQILLVEDDANDVLLMKRAFKKHFVDGSVHVARDGHEAINYLTGKAEYENREKYPFPDLVITDLKMPKMSGLELLAWIHDHKEYAVIPTIVLSASKADIDVAQAYELGANTYLVKPSEFDTLADMVQRIRDYWAMTIRPKRK